MTNVQNKLEKFLIKLQVFILPFFFLLFFIYRNLLFNLNTALYDWNDYPLITWIIRQNVEHIKNLDFTNFFESNIFHPHPYTMLLSDLLIPESLIAIPISYLNSNPIFLINTLFFIAWFLNIIAAYTLWKRLFKKENLFIAIFFTIFSPFTIINTAHFQLLNIWPFLFGLSYLLQEKLSKRDCFVLGIWIAVLYSSSVYLAVFLFTITVIYFVIKALKNIKQKRKLIIYFKQLAIISIIFLSLTSYLTYKYLQARKYYHAQPKYSDYVLYSADIANYFFTEPYDSILAKLPISQKWNSLLKKRNTVAFPGLVLVTLVFLAWKKNFKNKRKKSFFDIFFLSLLIFGFISSLGPRLSFNKRYIGLPLPYAVLLKLFPLLEPIRGTSRWFLLVNLGLIYFAVQGFSYLKTYFENKKILHPYLLIVIVIISYFVEIIPVQKQFESKEYYPASYQILEKACNQKSQVLLEYPLLFNPYDDERGIVGMLQHWTQITITTTKHNCKIINGYSGYFPPDFFPYNSQLVAALNDNNLKNIEELINQRQINYIKIHKNKLTPKEATAWENLINQLEHFDKIFENEEGLIIKVHPKK